jgi:hypothetical protein
MSADAQSNNKAIPRWITPISMLIVGLLAILLYGRALDFAFFNDDPTGHFAWMENRSLLDFFSSSAEYGYYRPVVFVTLKSLVTLGGYSAPLFHALLLLLNSANVAMLWLLAYRLGGSRAYAWAAALIFLTFPFSYEAVAYVASLTHPLLLFWLLLTILLYQQARDGRGHGRLFDIAAFITLLLGLFSHENGLFIPPALVGVEWLERPPRGWREGLKRPFLPYIGASALFFLLWLIIPKNSDQGVASLDTLINNLFPFLQSLVYPLLPLAQLSSANVTALLIISLLAILLLFGAAVIAGAKRLWLFALAWFGLSILPAILFLSSDYLYGSPRLHYLPAVGIALLLGLPVLALARRMPLHCWPRVVTALAAVLYTVAIILPPLSFIRCELDFYAEASTIVRQMGDIGSNVPAEQDLLFVNVPFFFSSYTAHPQGCENRYPWTPVGAVVIPPYASSRDFVRFNGGPDRPATAVTVPEYAPGWNSSGSTLPLAEVRQRLGETAVFVYDLTSGGFFDLSTAWQPGAPVNATPQANFGDRVALLDSAVRLNEDQNEIAVTLQWQVNNPADSPLTAFVHLYDQNGALIAQHDSPPGNNFIPPAFWQTADRIQDSHTIPLDTPLPAGIYTVAAGIYNPLDGQRLPAQTNNIPLADDILILQELLVQ